MTITDPTRTAPVSTAAVPFGEVAFDLYRDVHKAIRAELFAITTSAGRCDPNDCGARGAVADHVRSVMDLLVLHAHHEDGAIGPVMERELPDLAATIEHDHEALERRIDVLRDQAQDAATSRPGDERRALHVLYADLASFTSAYLAHQDLEERVVMPALETAIGVDAVLGIHQAIVGPMDPAELARALAIMLPAMNLEDRTDFLGGLAAGAPPEVVEGVWSLAGSVLEPADLTALARRFGR